MLDDRVTREIFGNIDPVSRWIFYALATAAMACFFFGVYRRIRLWRLGRKTEQRVDWLRGLTRFFTLILSQRTVHQGTRRKAASAAHCALFSGFAFLFVGTILIGIEHYSSAAIGRAPNNPLFHKGLYFAVFEFVLDTSGIALIVACGWFMIRRWQAASSIGRSVLDWGVLGILVSLALTGYLVEGLRIIREQTPQPGFSYVGLGVANVFQMIGIADRNNAATLHFGLWWLHAVLSLSFIAAFPYTRLLHSIVGAINVATRDDKLGVLSPIDIEDVEETGVVGVGHVQDFSRRQLMELDACVSCGRCEDACPAFAAGKPLSPRDLVQDIRVHLNAIGPSLIAKPGQVDGLPSTARSLHGDTISEETIWSCTACHACVDVCPLGVDPLGLITGLRRNRVGEGQFRGLPATVLQKMQRSGNPWGLPADERMAWAAGLDVPLAADSENFDVLYWVGCAAAYDRRIQKVARAVVRLLKTANVNFAVLGPEERCTGESARRIGDEFLFQELAAGNIETLTKHKVTKIVTHCPHCLNSFKNDYPQFGGDFEIVHHSQFLAELVSEGKLEIPRHVRDSMPSVTYHDPCFLARVNDESAAPRSLIELAVQPEALTEMPRNRRNTACCGAGGGRMWFDDSPDQRIGTDRVQEVLDTGADTVLVGCPFCLTMLGDGIAAADSKTQVQDIAELLVQALDEV